VLQRAVTFLLNGSLEQGRAELLELSQTDPVPRPKVDVPRRRVGKSFPLITKQRADTLQRNGWRCQYCGRHLVVAGAIEAIGTLCPKEFFFPPGHHMPPGTHPAAIRVYPNVDHIVAGEGNHPANLTAACTPCNELKNNFAGWRPTKYPADDWDGLVNVFRPLTNLVGISLTSTQRDWMRALVI
jgi:5-methylcytosine-specific restriction endonuclease McrA